MSKIFRIHEGGSNNVEDWSLVSHLSEHLVDAIKDPDGGISKKQITSIPTPFARLDLIRTAFKQVTNIGKAEGITTYHKLVSDCLDVAEIFFNSASLKEQIEIISWDTGINFQGSEMVINPNSDLGNLLYSEVPGHRLLGETLFLYLKQDCTSFNFDKLERIYLINYIGKGSGLMNVIGGTSPLTMFFSSANDLSRFVDLSFGTVKLFSENYTPLFKRDPDFIRYFYSIKSFFPQFTARFKELDEYLEMCFHLLPNSVKQDIKEIDRDTIGEEYQDIAVGHAGLYVTVLGEKLKCNRPEIEKIERLSDFVVNATKELKETKPLILPNKDFNEQLYYVKGNWQSNYRSPFNDNRPVNERTLPHHSYIQYPYLTVNDFLEPYIFRLPYPINKNRFFDGFYENKKHSFSIPIKKDFFKYFSIENLQQHHPDGKRWFELVPGIANAVEAILRIPIRGNHYVQFSKTYHDNHAPFGSRDSDGNFGGIVDSQIAVAVYPFLKTIKNENVHYRAMLLDTDTPNDRTQTEFNLSFYTENDIQHEVTIGHVNTRSEKRENDITAKYYVLQKEFDLMEISQPTGVRGLLVPLFKTIPQGATQFSFAIDFGTTNTHIEYRIDKGGPKPFEITTNDIQVGSTIKNDEVTQEILSDWKIGKHVHLLNDIIPVDFLPEIIGKGKDYSFPIRTVMAEKKGIDINLPTYTLADFSIPFAYEKKSSPIYLNIVPHLKWADFKNNPSRKRSVEAFIEELLLLIRNKVLLNGGNLEFTKITWSYPSSMSEFRRNTLENSWLQFTKKYISNSAVVNKISESVAPFYYFRTKEGVLAYDKPVVNIDIGGGTTDVVIFENNQPSCITSFRFAADCIFGDGYGNSPSVNGFVQKFYQPIKQKLINNDLYNLVNVLDQICNSENSQEITAFFFSLENNNLIREGNYPIAFSSDLKLEEDFKLVFVFFYAAIIYHVAKLMKAKNLVPPRHLLFSGMGSKVINIADTGFGLKNLSEFTNIIFRDVYNSDSIFIELKQYEEPKEITCKGALMCDEFLSTDDIKSVLIGNKEQQLVSENPLRYHQLNNRELLQSVSDEVLEFIDKFFSWNESFYFPKKFGVNPNGLSSQKLMLKDDLMQFLMAGVKEKLEEEKDNIELTVDETLFFYPIKGMLHRMAKHISKTHPL